MCMHVSHIIYVYDYMFLAYDLFIIYSDQFQFGSYQELKIKIVGVRIYVSFFSFLFFFLLTTETIFFKSFINQEIVKDTIHVSPTNLDYI